MDILIQITHLVEIAAGIFIGMFLSVVSVGLGIVVVARIADKYI